MNSGTVEIFRIMIDAQCAMSLDIFVGHYVSIARTME
jgi:hypothetical protein